MGWGTTWHRVNELVKGCHTRPLGCSYVMWLGLPCKVLNRFESLSLLVISIAVSRTCLRRIIYGTKILELEHDDDDIYDILDTLMILLLICLIYCLIMFCYSCKT